MNAAQFQKVSHRKYVIITLILTLLVTTIGLSQTLIWKVFPTIRLVFWFPVLIFTDRLMGYPNAGIEVLLSLMQFPILAICFIMGIRWWRPSKVLIVIGAADALMVLAAWIVLINSN
jgi:hypothetical protein